MNRQCTISVHEPMHSGHEVYNARERVEYSRQAVHNLRVQDICSVQRKCKGHMQCPLYVLEKVHRLPAEHVASAPIIDTHHVQH